MTGEKVTARRLVLVLLVGVGVTAAWLKVANKGATGPNLTARWRRAPKDSGRSGGGNSKSSGSSNSNSRRSCTVDELLPRQMGPLQNVSSEWSHEDVVEPPYGCDCASSKARYFCPNLGFGGYPRWGPRAVAEGVCRSRTREEMTAAGGPLPPGFKVLFYGNSYVRQVVEAVLCVFERDLTSKRVRFKSSPVSDNSSPQQEQQQQMQQQQQQQQQQQPEVMEVMEEERTVPGGEPCRACSKFRVLENALVESGCIADDGGGACRCDDDHGEFFFSNGAAVHFFFAHDAPNKTVADALAPHGDPDGPPDFSHYDAVFANEGNEPPMEAEAVLEAALELRDLGVPFFWLSTYEGRGDPKDWTHRQETDFYDSGAKFVRVGDMAHGLDRLTRKGVEQLVDPDPHFCMPGVPDEIGLLLLKLTWAMYEEAS